MAEHTQRVATVQQQQANRRAIESDAQREHHLCANRECIATYRVNVSVEERLLQRENDHINAARRRNTARQSMYDRQRSAFDQFRQSLYSGPLNLCYCCTHLCWVSMMSSSSCT